jgi:probable rRNA maturation factor
MSPDASVDDCTVLFRALPTCPKFAAEEKRAITNFARMLAHRIANGRSFTCLITGDSELRRLNRAFLGCDYPTDVLSFPAFDSSVTLGEIAISADRANAQALSLGHPHLEELRVLILHGLLHLVGMDHEHDSGEMACAERKWRAELNLPQTLIARASASSAQRVLGRLRASKKRSSK